MSIPPSWRALAALALVLSAWSAVSAAEGGVTIPLPARPLAFELEHPAAPLEPASLTLNDSTGGTLAGPLVLHGGRDYDWRVLWRPGHAMLPRRESTLVLRLDMGGPFRESECRVLWAERSPEPCSGRLSLPAASGSGRSTLTLLLSVAEGGAATVWPLAVVPVTVEPVPAPSTLSDARIREVFGADAVRLNVRFRLGPGAALEIPVPEGVPFSRAGFVGSMAWLPRQERLRGAGRLMAEFQALEDGQDGETLSFPIRLGVETLQTDHEAFDRETTLEKDAVPLFDTWTVDGPGGPSPRSNYHAVFAPGRRFVPRALRVALVADEGVLQVDELVLLP